MATLEQVRACLELVDHQLQTLKELRNEFAAEIARRDGGCLTKTTAEARGWANYAIASQPHLSLCANLAQVLLEQCDRTEALELPPRPDLTVDPDAVRGIALKGLSS